MGLGHWAHQNSVRVHWICLISLEKVNAHLLTSNHIILSCSCCCHILRSFSNYVTTTVSTPPHTHTQKNPRVHELESCQGRNQVCSQRWTMLENLPFPDFFPVEIFILVNPKQISGVSISDKKGPLLIFIPFPFHSKFSSSPFTIYLLFLTIFPFLCLSFPFPPLFPLPSLFPPSPFLPKFPQTIQGWATRSPHPPLVTPLSHVESKQRL